METFYDTVTGQVSKIEIEGSRASANWEFEYNSLGDKTVFEDPASGKTEFVYNTHGDVIQQKQKSESSDVVVDFSYDQLGRVIRRKDNDGTTTWKYFNNSKQIETVSRINSDETYSSEMTFYYDQYDRPNRKETKIIEGDQSGQGKTFVEYLAYDNQGRVVKRTLPNDLEVDYSYNEHGNLESISTPRTLARENVRGFDKDHLALVKKLAEQHAAKLLSDAAEYSAKAQEYKEYK